MDIGIEFERRNETHAAGSALPIFRCGAKVRGRVILIVPVSGACPIRSIELELLGDRILTYRQRHTVTLLSHRELLAGENHDLQLSPGRHVFPFVFSIPKGLPSTFTGAYAKVQYLAKASVDFGSKPPLEIAEPFVVLSCPSPKFLKPFRATGQQEGIMCKWRLDRRDFQQNEFIFINADVANRKKGPRVTALSASLVMEATFQSHNGEPLKERQVLASFRDPACLSKDQGRRWTEVSLHIPELAPSSCENGSCRFSYYLQLRVERESGSIGIHLTVPLTVGVEVAPHHRLNRHPDKQSQFDSVTEMALNGRASENSSFRGSINSNFKRHSSDFGISEIEENVVVKTNPLFVDDDEHTIIPFNAQRHS